MLINSQRGAALIVSLVFLLLLTLIGVVSIEDSTLQERMAGNTRDYETAFQGAETALRVAEDLLSQSTIPDFNGTNGLYGEDDDNYPSWSERDSSVRAGKWKVLDDSTLYNVSQQPEYFIRSTLIEASEDTSSDIANIDATRVLDESIVYRITATGYGATPTTRVILESSFVR